MNRSVREKSRDWSFLRLAGLKHCEVFMSRRMSRAVQRMATTHHFASVIAGSDFVIGVKDGKTKILELP